MAKRPPMPADLQREVLIEAGHRCAIHSCRQVPVEIAHITPWAKCKEHRFDNLIALCPTCHTRFDQGEIDRKAMLIYKGRLAVINDRYGDLEQRVLKFLAEPASVGSISLLADFEILLGNLLADGMLEESGPAVVLAGTGTLTRKSFRLTEQGRSFADRWTGVTQP